MKVLLPLAIVIGLFLLGMLGAEEGMGWVFGVVIPYVAVGLFLGGLLYRVASWARVPVPFRIPTTCGQQRSLPWIKEQSLENPSGSLEAFGRMVFEVLFFRSLLRNTKSHLREGGKLVYATDLWLWLGAMAMHWSLLIILIRHVRLVTTPVPGLVTFVGQVDGFFEVGLPVIYATSVIFVLGLTYLLFRRLASAQLRYISQLADYFPLFLLLGIGLSGFFLRYLQKTDVVGIKELAVSLARFSPSVPESLSPLFYGHFFLVSALLAYFSFSKLVHMPGVFFSPTRNLANSNRRVRHVNPWDHPVKVHTYEEYENENREKMVEAGLPVDKE